MIHFLTSVYRQPSIVTFCCIWRLVNSYNLVQLNGSLIMYLENPDIGWLISYNKSLLFLTLNVGLQIEVVNNSYLGEAVFVSFSYLVNISLPGLVFLINKLKIFSIKIFLKSHFHFLCKLLSKAFATECNDVMTKKW